MSSLEARLLPSNDFPYGEGIFETFPAANGVPVFFEEHWERLKNSSLYFRYSFPFDPLDVFKKIRASISSAQIRGIRLTYKPNSGLIFQILEQKELPKEWKLVVSVDKPHPLASHKITDRAHYEDLWKKAFQEGCQDMLMVSDEGRILETTRANIFMFAKGKLITPPANGKILPGIARLKVIQQAAHSGIPVEEREIILEELSNADLFFVTNSLIGIAPVQEIKSFWIGEKQLTSLTCKLKILAEPFLLPPLNLSD